jgi:small subunit ribosomal protein S16
MHPPSPRPRAWEQEQEQRGTQTAANPFVSRTARNSKPLEVIGTYDPIPKKDSYDESGKLHKDIRLDVDRAKYWIGVGAQPTDTVWRFLSMVRTCVSCRLFSGFQSSPGKKDGTEIGIMVRRHLANRVLNSLEY